MKKIYFYLALLLCTFCSATISADTETEDIDLTFCLRIDDPSLCYITNSDNERFALNEGENIFSLTLHKTTYNDGSVYAYSDGFYLNIEDDKINDYRITACSIEVGGDRSDWNGFRGTGTSMYISLDSEEMNGCTLYPTITNLNDLRTATATVVVDDASKVQLRCGYQGYMPELVNGTNTIKFDPVGEARWTIGARNYGEYLGGVTQNDNKVDEYYGNFELMVSEGDNIVINTQVNNEPVAVTIGLANEGTEGAIKGVYKFVNYKREEVADWKAGFEVAPRSDIILSLNQNDYKINSVTVNGVPQSIYSDDLYITITEASTIVVDAEKYSTFPVILSITDPAHVTVGVAESQYSGSTELTNLVAGEQTLDISCKNNYMLVSQKEGYVINKVAYVVNGEENSVEAGYSGYCVPLISTEKVIVVSSVDVTTGIDSAKASCGKGKIYNMIGVEVKDVSHSGVYIVNGKKFSVK